MIATAYTTSIGNRRRNDRGIYIGRPSALGNPFVIGKDGDRATVIRKYAAWLAEQLKNERSAASVGCWSAGARHSLTSPRAESKAPASRRPWTTLTVSSRLPTLY
jgi:hypothetical protein